MCEGCGQTSDDKNPRPIRTVLDSTELLLQRAWISEIQPEDKELAKQLIRAVQALKKPQTIPLEYQLLNLTEACYDVVTQIPCRYCRRKAYYGLVERAFAELEFARGHIWKGTKLTVTASMKEIWWMILAGLYRILVNRILVNRTTKESRVALENNL